MAVSAAVLFCGMTPLYIHADFDSSQENLRIYELSMLDADPLYTLKKSVLYNRSIDDESLDLTNVDLDRTTIEVDRFDRNSSGLQRVTVKIGIVSQEDKESGVSFGYTFTENIALKMIRDSAPQLKLVSDEVIVNNNDAWNPDAYIAYIYDDSGILPVILEDDNVNMEKDGHYHATYTAIDQEGNKTTATMLVTVRTHKEVIAERIAQAKAERLARLNALGTRFNPYGGGWSNCTWGAWQLAYSHLGIHLPQWGMAGNWVNGAQRTGYNTGNYPKVGSIAVYSGHVAYVAGVSADGSRVYIKEGGFLGGYHERWVSRWGTGSQALRGYIYLNE